MEILLATDGSGHSEEAARFLAGLELAENDLITVLHVISGAAIKDDPWAHRAAVMELKRNVAPKILDATIEAMGPVKARVTTAVADGYADKAIVDFASETGASFVVLGARGLRGIKAFLIGSTTRAVAITSPRPVLVVKPRKEGRSGPLKALFASDGSDYADSAARAFASIPFPGDTSVTVLTVLWSSYADIPDRYAMEIDDRVKEAVAALRSDEFREAEAIFERARKILSSKFGEIAGMAKVGDPTEEILKAEAETGADLVVVGSRGLRGIRGMMGSVSRKVLAHAAGSVLVGKGGPHA
ncbi:MAG: hypothetical protein Kow0025_15790 [Thermodesulfovibrionales bacterium]